MIPASVQKKYTCQLVRAARHERRLIGVRHQQRVIGADGCGDLAGDLAGYSHPTGDDQLGRLVARTGQAASHQLGVESRATYHQLLRSPRLKNR